MQGASEVETVRFPDGGSAQHDIAKWVEDHGGNPHLYDGVVEDRLTEPAEDGSYFRWKYMYIGEWPHALRVKPGDHITCDSAGVFTVHTAHHPHQGA